MELELIPRPCPFCGDDPDIHCYHDRAGKLNMCSINCNNEYCMVQPGIQMYGSDAQRNAVAYWNGERKILSAERAAELKRARHDQGSAHIYHSVSGEGYHAYWCGWCGHIVQSHDHYCSDCGSELIEIVEV